MKQYAEQIIYQDGAFPEPHEIRIARLLINRTTEKIIFLAPNRNKDTKTPDIEMNNLKWEIKSPKGKSSRTIENNFRATLKQSQYVIFDLHRINVPTNQAIAQIKKQIYANKGAKRVIIITSTYCLTNKRHPNLNF